MKKISLLAAAVTTLGLSGTALAEVFAFISMPLTASQETPAVNSTGYGRITALYDNVTKVLTYNVTWQLNAGATPTNNHFHQPGPLGVAGPASVPLPALPTTNSGRAAGTVTLTAAAEADLLAGNMYYNLHSTLAAGGELRGQMIQNPNATEAVFQNNVLTLGNVLVPGIAGAQSYRADLTYNGSTFSLTSATPVR